MFKLLRFYSTASFICIFITAVILILFYRQVTTQWNIRLAEESNATLAQTVLNSIRPALIKYLEAEADANPGVSVPQKFPAALAETIENVIRDTSVIRIKIYNRNGILSYSSSPRQIGTNLSNNTGFMSAINGRVVSSLIYRDSFNSSDNVTEKDNLLQSYIPIRSGQDAPIQGVFEIYTDVNKRASENRFILFVTLVGTELIMAILFVILLFVVRRVNQNLEAQQQGIRNRMATLEILSDRLLHSNELEKKKIAFELHEGLAQTLSAIKLNVESSRKLISADDENAKSLDSIVPVIQGAIQKARSIATELRPSSLDDLGLIPTINRFCREFERLHQGIQVEIAHSSTEAQIPVKLKIVIYRIIESAFHNIVQHIHTEWIQLALQIENDEITLKISGASEGPSARREKNPDLQLHFAEMRERTMLSNGTFSATQDLIGKVTLTSSWASQGTAAT